MRTPEARLGYSIFPVINRDPPSLAPAITEIAQKREDPAPGGYRGRAFSFDLCRSAPVPFTCSRGCFADKVSSPFLIPILEKNVRIKEPASVLEAQNLRFRKRERGGSPHDPHMAGRARNDASMYLRGNRCEKGLSKGLQVLYSEVLVNSIAMRKGKCI